ncbi:primosomal protein [Kineococcus sp. GCM10028916]|uniref:primosomal protein n=1 Tax=Kineococcus sp. GCM10028916 TaxID=3273394 RepID=UPI003636E098
MTDDPRAALARLVATLEDHLAASANRRGETDPAVADAYQRVADAFEAYEEALYDAYDEVTPFVLYDDVEDDREDDDEDDEDDDPEDDESDSDDEDSEDPPTPL